MNTLSPLAQARRGARQSRFEKDQLNRYDTIDPRAVEALLPHLAPGTRFIEPCAGKGDLVRQLQAAGHVCLDQFDIQPRAAGIRQQDALAWERSRSSWDRHVIIITNPPFDWPLVRDLINHWSDQVLLQWLLLEASFAHTRRAGPLMQKCRKIVSIGRLRWVEGTAAKSTKDYAWCQFGVNSSPGNTAQFYGRGWRNPALLAAAIGAPNARCCDD
jgi:hypothetical protein